jgi:uncharacterized membrane protein (UPF0136 family)
LNRQLRARKDLSTTELRCDYVLKTGLPAKELPRERLVSWLARVSRVLGRVFDGAAADSGPQKTAAGWLLKGGQVVALLSEIAVPRRWWSSSLRRLLIMVLVAGLVLVVAGVMMRRDQVWTLGLSVVAVSALAFAVAYPLRLWMLRRTSGPVSVLKRLISLVVIVIVAAGVYQVYQLLREYVLPWFDAHWPPW